MTETSNTAATDEKISGDGEKVAVAGSDQASGEVDSPPASLPNEMKAIVLTGYGGLKSVKIQRKPEPTAADGEVLIRVKAW